VRLRLNPEQNLRPDRVHCSIIHSEIGNGNGEAVKDMHQKCSIVSTRACKFRLSFRGKAKAPGLGLYLVTIEKSTKCAGTYKNKSKVRPCLQSGFLRSEVPVSLELKQ